MCCDYSIKYVVIFVFLNVKDEKESTKRGER